MDDPAEATAEGADTDIAAFADEPADVVETAPIAEEEDKPVLVVVTAPVTLVEAEDAEPAPAVVPAAVPMPTELPEAVLLPWDALTGCAKFQSDPHLDLSC